MLLFVSNSRFAQQLIKTTENGKFLQGYYYYDNTLTKQTPPCFGYFQL